MANNMRAMPMFVIDTCSSEDNQETISLKSNTLPRSLSLLNSGDAYKDLSGTIHYSSLTRLKNSFLRSYSCPNNFSSKTKSAPFHSPSVNVHFSMNLLNPSNGTHSPADSSSRYSLYGSFLDLSEKNYPPSLIKTDNKLFAIDGRPLLITDHSSKLSTTTYHDKCNDWLSHLNPI
jgi:hypothetical protein